MVKCKRWLSLLLSLVLVVSMLPLPNAAAADTVTKNTGSFSYTSGGADYSATFYYDDGYFTPSAYTYQDSLATMSLCLAMSAFGSAQAENTDAGYAEKSQNLRQLLTACGFPEENFAVNEWFLTKPTQDSIGAGASHKAITANGEAYTLIALAVRGGEYESEWASNFTLGSTGDHQGFAEARDQVLAFLKTYISDHAITGNVKLWITGYSRGAITANMAAGLLDSGYSLAKDIKLLPEDIYAYCFECPQGVQAAADTANALYANIFNIINPGDIVTKLAPMLPSQFGFQRYGINRYLPTALKSGSSFAALREAMLERYFALPSTKEYVADNFQMKQIAVDNLIWDVQGLLEEGIVVNDADSKWDQNAFLDEALYKLFSEIIRSRENYVSTYQADLRELCKVVFGSEGKWGTFADHFTANLEDEIITVAACLMLNLQLPLLHVIIDAATDAMNQAGITDYTTARVESFALKVVQVLMAYGISHPELTVTAIANLESIAGAHYPEVCLAWLQSFDPNYTTQGAAAFNSGVHRILRLHGAVNATVYDAAGNPAAAITNGAVQQVGNSTIVAYTNAQGEKLLYLPADEAYTISVKSLFGGYLTCSIQEFSEDAGGVNRIANFYDISLTPGGSYTVNVPAAPASYTVLTPDGTTLTPDVELRGADAANANFTVTVTSNNTDYGVVTGSDTVKLGEYVKLTAIPNEGCDFAGWYQGDQLLSTETEYVFRLTADKNITGMFHLIPGYTRISGNNRYATSLETANALLAVQKTDAFQAVVVASGEGYADALSGSYLAIQKNAPILLTNAHNEAAVKAYIAENLVPGGTVYLLGGEQALPASMEAGLENFRICRLQGGNRYQTNLAILEEAGTAGQEILICSGNGFADSLSASAVGKPILLVNKSLSDDQVKFLESTSGKLIIIGGESAVSAELEKALKEYGEVERLGGKNRYETSVLVAERFFDAPDAAILAYSQNFPDGLCGGPLAEAMKAPLLLIATDRGPAVVEYAKEAGITTGAVLGGTGLIDDATARKVFRLDENATPAAK